MRRLWWLAAAVLVFHAAALLTLADKQPIGDEGKHYWQIERFYRGEWTYDRGLAMLPGYHLVAATAARIGGGLSLPFVKVLTWLFGLAALGLFYAAAPDAGPRDRFIRTAQLAVFPLIFPFYFMAYSDVPSLAVLLCATAACFRGRYGLAGVLAALSLGMRQSNIVWSAFLWARVYVEDNGYRFSWGAFRAHCLKTKAFLAGFGLFAVFFIVNGRVSIGIPSFSPDGVFTGNLFFSLLLMFLIFLPLHAAYLAQRGLSVSRRGLLLAAGLFVLYFATFGRLHFMNDLSHPLFQGIRYAFVRNVILSFFLANGLLKALFFLPMLGGLRALAPERLMLKSGLLWYGAAAVYLVPHWVIEPRYTIVPAVYWMLVRKMEPPKAEYAQLALSAVLSAALWYGVWSGKYLL